MRTRAEYDVEVRGPGKFEGEPAWTPYFWDLVLEGDGETVWEDGESGEFEHPAYDKFRISGEDTDLFPELKSYVGRELRVWADSHGFVKSKIV